MKKIFHLTKEKLEELEQELVALKAQRSEIAEKIKTAREFGDLAENAEYQSARLEKDKLEARRDEIEHILQSSDIIKKPKKDTVGLGSTVTLKNGKERKFQVVGTVEADPLAGKISDESPLGKELLGKKLGDEVVIKTPTESTAYKLVEIA